MIARKGRNKTSPEPGDKWDSRALCSQLNRGRERRCISTLSKKKLKIFI